MSQPTASLQNPATAFWNILLAYLKYSGWNGSWSASVSVNNTSVTATNVSCSVSGNQFTCTLTASLGSSTYTNPTISVTITPYGTSINVFNVTGTCNGTFTQQTQITLSQPVTVQ